MSIQISNYVKSSFPIYIDQHDSLSDIRNIINKNFKSLMLVFDNLRFTDLDLNISGANSGDNFILRYNGSSFSFVKYDTPTLTTSFSNLSDIKINLPLSTTTNYVLKYDNIISKFVVTKQSINQDEIPRGTQYIFENTNLDVPENSQYIIHNSLVLNGTSTINLPGHAILVII